MSALRVSSLAALALAALLALPARSALARPGGGFSIEPSDSAAPASTTPRPRPATSAKAPPHASAEPWSARPPYAAPWAKDRTVSEPQTGRRPALARTSPKVERAHGGLVEFYFYFVLGGALAVVALAALARRGAARAYEVGSLAREGERPPPP